MVNKIKKNILLVTRLPRFFWGYALLVAFIILPVIVSAYYNLLEDLPTGGSPNTGLTGLSDYLEWLYKFALGAAAFLAVLMIVIGGVQMIVGGASETARSDGKKRIEQALWGLLLAISAWLIVYTINPDFINTGLSIPGITVTSMKSEDSSSSGNSSGALVSTSFGSWKFDSGISDQENDASDSLKSLLSCMRGKITDTSIGTISSISDSSYIGNLGSCNGTSSSCPTNCAHSCGSCHYGGGSSGNKSYAVDFGDESNYSTISSAANECKAKYVSKLTDKGHNNHIHVSVSDCPKN